MVCAALRRLSPFEAWVICERFGLGEPPGRGIPRTSPERDREGDGDSQRDPGRPSGAGAGPRDAGQRVLLSSAHTSIWDGIAGSACSASARSRRRPSTSCVGFWADRITDGT